jgi:hypothetical protein
MHRPFGFDTLGSRIVVVDSVVGGGEIGRMNELPAAGQGYVTTSCPPAASIDDTPRKNKDAKLIFILVVI